jgi:NAD(P)-dependent dehydrogenase (short-subunit alcohol dehydrogenase family)
MRGILGPDAWSIFMRWLRRRAERFSVAASLVGRPGDGWRFRPGCSIGRPARPGVLAAPYLGIAVLTALATLLQDVTSVSGEVSGLIVYLASDESRYCTGSEFIINGGYTAQ